ncbi:MAG: glutamyl-tRNA reductase [Cryomorphaceae bacterium]
MLHLKHFKVIALTHRHLGLDLVGKFHVEPDQQKLRFEAAFVDLEIKECMFLSTCNRVEFFFRTPNSLTVDYVDKLLAACYPHLKPEEIEAGVQAARLHSGEEAIRHIFHVASSLDSLVIGEREIITQVRTAFERASSDGFTGDYIRLAIQKAVETAKQVYTETAIATKPISVVNLAYRKLLEYDLSSETAIIYIGAGQTIEAIAGNLRKHSFKSVKVFNRTAKKAEKLAEVLGGQGYGLNDLVARAGEFDVIVTCTGSDRSIINSDTFKSMGVKGKKTIVDLAIPNDIDASVLTHFDVDYISIEDLKGEAKLNLRAREKEVFRCEQLVEQRLEEFEDAFKTRKLELAMQEVPALMKEIKLRALDKTFAKEIDQMDPEARKTLEKVIDYLEKKYISLPMKMAKQVVLEQDLKDPILEH